MDASGHVLVVDTGTCRLRRLTYASQVVWPVNCSTPLTELLRPSGCSSYDPPVDLRDMTATAAFGNLHYNHDGGGSNKRYAKSKDEGYEPRGRSVKNCVGSPPPDKLDKKFYTLFCYFILSTWFLR